jgi:hypothetical protein
MEKVNERQKAAELILDYLTIVVDVQVAKECAMKCAKEIQKLYNNDDEEYIRWNHIIVEILSF